MMKKYDENQGDPAGKLMETRAERQKEGGI